MDRILVLNASYMPLGMVTWMKAICLLWQDKAEVVEAGERIVRSPSLEMQVPSIVRLTSQVPFHRRRTRLSRTNLLRRDDYTCQYCGKRLPASELNMDHVIPRSRGGRPSWTNIVTACVKDNHRKGSKTPAEAGMRLLREPRKPSWSVADEIRLAVPAVPESWKIYLPSRRRR